MAALPSQVFFPDLKLGMLVPKVKTHLSMNKFFLDERIQISKFFTKIFHRILTIQNIVASVNHFRDCSQPGFSLVETDEFFKESFVESSSVSCHLRMIEFIKAQHKLLDENLTQTPSLNNNKN